MIRVLVLTALVLLCQALSPNGTIEIKIGCNLNTPSSAWTVRQRIAQLNQKTDLISPNAVLKLVFYNHTNNNLKTIQDSLNIINDGAIASIGTGTSARSVLASYIYQTKPIPQCCGASSSSDLSSKTLYPNFFRTVPNDVFEGTAALEFIKAYGWSNIALVFVKDTIGISSAAFVASSVKNYNMTILTQIGLEVGANDASIYAALGRILDFDSRIILYFGNSEYSQVIAQAKLLGVYGLGYAWIGSPGINKPAVKTGDSAGTIYFSPNERDVNPVSDEFERLYQQDPNSTTNLTLNAATGLNIAQYGYLCCLDLIVYGFDRFLKADPNRKVELLANGTYQKQFKVPDTFNFLDIDTPSGRVFLDKNGDRSGAYSYFYIDKSGNGVEFGKFDRTFIPKASQVFFPGNTTTKPVDVIRPVDIAVYADPNNWLGLFLYAFLALSLLATVLSFILTIYVNRWKLTSTGIDVKIVTHICLIGACFQFLVMIGLPDNTKCAVDAVLLSFLFTPFHASILVFNYRIYSIFNNVGATLKKVTFVLSPLTVTLFYCIPPLAIGITWLTVDSPTAALIRVSNTNYYWTCSSASRFNQQLFFNLTMVYQALLLALNCLLALRCAHIESSTKFIKNTSRVIMFNTSLVLSAGIVNLVPGSSFQIKLMVKALALFSIIVFDIYEMFLVSHLQAENESRISETGGGSQRKNSLSAAKSEPQKPDDFSAALKNKISERFALVTYKPMGGLKGMVGEQRLYLMAASSKNIVNFFNIVNKGIDREDLALGDKGFCYNALYVHSFNYEPFGETGLRLQMGIDHFELNFSDHKEMNYWKVYFLNWKQGVQGSNVMQDQ